VGFLPICYFFCGLPHLADYFDHAAAVGRVSRRVATGGFNAIRDLDQVRPVERSSSYERPSRPYSLAATRTVDVLPRVAAQGQLAPARSGGRVGLCGCRLALVHTKLPRFS